MNMQHVFRSLSEPCPPVIERAVEQVVNLIQDRYVVAISVSGCYFTAWNNGIGKERTLKYVAKRTSSSFDLLVWVMMRSDSSSKSNIKKFQTQIAQALSIPYPKQEDDDEDDGGEQVVDEILSDRIRFQLNGRKFFMVHNGDWELEDLEKMGIPSFSIRSADYKVLASTTKILKMHQSVSMNFNNLSDEEVRDLIREECVDIADSPNLRGRITPDDAFTCLFHIHVYPIISNIRIAVWFWFAEGIIGGSNNMDLDAIMQLGKTLVSEFSNHCLVNLKSNHIFTFPLKSKITESKATYPCDYRSIFSVSRDYDEATVGDTNWLFFELRNAPPREEHFNLNLDGSKVSMLSMLWESIECLTNYDEFCKNANNVRVLDIYSPQVSSLPSSLVCLSNSLRMLRLTACSSLKSLQVPYFKTLRKLEILDLSCTSLEYLPHESFECLESLRVLDLSNCRNIISLPTSISSLLNLEHLFLRNCENLKELPCSVPPPLENLLLLDLFGTELNEIPEQFFQRMSKRRYLSLSSNPCLKSLPISISNLINLKILNLENCTALQNVTPALQTLSSSLKVIKLSYTRISSLSLTNFTCLQNMSLLPNIHLCVLDLSGSTINKFPLGGDIIEHDSNLMRLDLVGVKHLRKIDWASIRLLPRQVNLDQRGGDGDGTAIPPPVMFTPLDEWRREQGESGAAFIAVQNGDLFKTLQASHPWINGRFLVYVCPSTKQGELKKELKKHCHRLYNDILTRMKASVPSYSRCLEIERVVKCPKNLMFVLSKARLICLHDEGIVTRLSDIGGVEHMAELRHCWIERCHAMKILFDIKNSDLVNQPLLRCLENLRISNLKKLTNVCLSLSSSLEQGSFGKLKHLQLEYCPQVVTVFSPGVCLESLEVLKIRFCARLEQILSGGKNSLQQLHTLSLWELPKLTSVACNVQLVALRNVQVNGCPKLRKFPSLGRFNNKLVMRGESEWWQRLEWEDKTAKHHICFNAWKPLKFPKRI